MSATYDARGNTTALGGQSYTWDLWTAPPPHGRAHRRGLGPGRCRPNSTRTTGAATSPDRTPGDGDSPHLAPAGGQAALQLGLPGGAWARLTSTGTDSGSCP